MIVGLDQRTCSFQKGLNSTGLLFSGHFWISFINLRCLFDTLRFGFTKRWLLLVLLQISSLCLSNIRRRQRVGRFMSMQALLQLVLHYLLLLLQKCLLIIVLLLIISALSAAGARPVHATHWRNPWKGNFLSILIPSFSHIFKIVSWLLRQNLVNAPHLLRCIFPACSLHGFMGTFLFLRTLSLVILQLSLNHWRKIILSTNLSKNFICALKLRIYEFLSSIVSLRATSTELGSLKISFDQWRRIFIGTSCSHVLGLRVVSNYVVVLVVLVLTGLSASGHYGASCFLGLFDTALVSAWLGQKVFHDPIIRTHMRQITLKLKTKVALMSLPNSAIHISIFSATHWLQVIIIFFLNSQPIAAK
jgi:hypothetical protein